MLYCLAEIVNEKNTSINEFYANIRRVFLAFQKHVIQTSRRN